TNPDVRCLDGAMACRLCLDPGGEERQLLSPCACRGSSAHVHADCLLQWCERLDDYRHFVGPAALLCARHRFRRLDKQQEEGPQQLEATYQLAQALAAEGQHAEALKLFTYLHRVYERRKGEMHIDTLAVASSCALSLSALKKHEEAALLQEATLASLLEKLGSSHTRYVTESNNLALTLTALGRHEEALPLLRHALDVRERGASVNSQEWIKAANNLAGSLSKVGELAEAVEVFQRAIASCRRVLGEQHPLAMQMQSNLAVVLHQLGRCDEARELQAKLVPLLRQSCGLQDERTRRAAAFLKLLEKPAAKKRKDPAE
ncbi:unnamed protein product, partial [Effrenium voratum]